jgi:FHS family L-fucose permease-like MFS transporter
MAVTPVSKSSAVSAAPIDPQVNYTGAMAMVTTLFFMWGFITCLNDILIPHLKAIFDLSYFQVMTVQFAFFTGYFICSMPAGKLIEWFGFKKTMVIGLCTMAAGALLFVPAANLPSFPLFLTALFIVAAGMTALQVSANPYVSVLGTPDHAASRLNLAQAFNSLGTTVAPTFGSILILSTVPLGLAEIRALSPDALQTYRLHEAATVKTPYLILAAALLALAVAIALFKLPQISSAGDADHEAAHVGRSIWSYSHLVLGVVGIFVYVGAEVSIGSFLVNYFTQDEIGGLTEKAAAAFVSFYWGGAMVGRFIGAGLLQKVKPGLLLGIFAIAAAVLVATSMLTTGPVAMWSIIAVGLFNSIMFPTIFTLGIAELGPLTGRGSGLLIAAILGGALIPVAQGKLADTIGIHHAFVLPVICYAYILYYGLIGSKVKQRVPAAA